MEKKLHLYNSKSDYLNEKDSFTPIYNVSYVIDTDEVLYNYVSGQGDTPIVFADSEVKRLCVENWGSNGEITYNQAAAVTDIGTVFSGNVAITSFDELQYFTGLQEISRSAFKSCYILTSITIPNSITTIDTEALASCSSLTSVTIPDGVTTIGHSAFASCLRLKSITIPDSVTTIGGFAFYNCQNITSITIPNGVTTIGSSLFSNCPSLTSVTIPNSVTTIGEGAFASCSSLTSVTIPDNVTTIGANVFNRCSGLTSITSYAVTAPTIGNKTFRSVPTDGKLYIPANATGYNVWMKTDNYYLGLYNWTLSSYTS